MALLSTLDDIQNGQNTQDLTLVGLQAQIFAQDVDIEAIQAQIAGSVKKTKEPKQNRALKLNAAPANAPASGPANDRDGIVEKNKSKLRRQHG